MEKNKNINSKEHREKIDSREIHKKLGNLSEKSLETQKNAEAALKIGHLGKKLGDKYNLKYSIKENGSYILQINGNTLNMEIASLKRLDETIKIIEKGLINTDENSNIRKIKEFTGLGDNSLSLSGDIEGRKIRKDSSIGPVGFDEKVIESKNTIFSKNDVEELFVFFMKVKGIAKENWDIESTICANNKITDECKNELGNGIIK